MLPTQASRTLAPRTAARSATKALAITTAMLLFAGLVSDGPGTAASRRGGVEVASGAEDGAGSSSDGGGTAEPGGTAIDPATGEPIADGGDGTTQSGDGGRGGAAGGSPGGVAGGPGSTTAAGSAALTASDVGVTKDSIKLGVLIPNLNELAQAGFRVGVPGDHRKLAEAWAKEVNDKGGILGRKVTFVYDVFSVFDVDDMTRACKKMTEDEKVFSVINLGGYDSVAQLCIAKEHKTPLIAGDPQPAKWYTDSAPYLWTPLMNKDRTHRNHMRQLKESGLLQKGRDVVGLIYHGIPNVGPSVEQSLLPELRDNSRGNGIEPKVIVKLSDDSNQALNQINAAVLQMNREGVNYVIMPMNLIFKAQFMNTAEGQNFFPKYTDSDHYFGCYDFTTSAYPEKSFNRMTCVTATNSGIKDPFNNPLANPPYQRYADAVYKNRYPGYYEEGCGGDQDCADAQRALHYAFGTNFLMWKEAAERVGPNLTRAAWGAQMGRTGNWTRVVTSPSLSHGPNKFDGPDTLAVVQWFAEAGDGYRARRFRQVKPHFPAYY
jgi:hypothetical protein